MTHTGRYHGGLVFLGSENSALDRFSRIVCATLEDYGHTVERQTILDPREARIVSSLYHVNLKLESLEVHGDRTQVLDAAAGLNRKRRPVVAPTCRNRLSVTLTPVADTADDRDLSELLLVVMLYRSVDIYAAEVIEWLEPDVTLTIDQFLSAFANVAPRRVAGRQQVIDRGGERFAPVDESVPDLAQRYDRIVHKTGATAQTGLVELSDQEALALAFRSGGHPNDLAPEDLGPNDLQRLTSWGMTGCLAFVSAPVAVSMAAVNLIRGEDFRLNTQVLSLTSALVVLQSNGAMADVLTYLPI